MPLFVKREKKKNKMVWKKGESSGYKPTSIILEKRKNKKVEDMKTDYLRTNLPLSSLESPHVPLGTHMPQAEAHCLRRCYSDLCGN